MPKTKHLQTDFKGLTDWVEIFLAGMQADSNGKIQQFTRSDLDKVIENHDPQHPAPHVITHKEMYSPFAYGQVAELKREGDALLAKSTNVEPQFESLIKNGRLYERSIRLVPGKNGWKLGHIAWLGAEPPAVEGMAPVSFAAEDTGLDFSLDTQTPHTLVRMMRNMREFLIEHFSKDQADDVMPGWEIDSLERHVSALENTDTDDTLTQFSKQPGEQDMPEITQADIDAAVATAVAAANQQASADFSAQKGELQQQLDAERAERQQSEFTALIQSHIERGVAPADLAGAVDFMMQLQADDAGVFEFSQKAGDKTTVTKTSQLDFVKSLMDKIPAKVDTTQTEFDDTTPGNSDFNAPSGSHVDADSLAIHNKALEYQQSHPDVEYLTAVQLVSK